MGLETLEGFAVNQTFRPAAGPPFLPPVILALITSFFCFGPAYPVAAAETPIPVRPTFLLIVGAPGDAEFGSNFLRQATLWEKACSQIDSRKITIGLSELPPTNDLALLQQALADEPKEPAAELWLVFIGHGTFDGKEARFN
jgi:hypothetical protein